MVLHLHKIWFRLAGLPDRDLDCSGVTPEPRKELRRPPLAEDGVAFSRVTSLFSSGVKVGGVKVGGVKMAALTFLGGAGVYMSSAIHEFGNWVCLVIKASFDDIFSQEMLRGISILRPTLSHTFRRHFPK